jgi:DNA-binding protein HU-beta
MRKLDLVDEISTKTSKCKKEISIVVEELMHVIKQALEQGDKVYLKGFGSFNVKQRAEKKARDIGRKSIVIVPAHNIPVFIPAKEFKERVKSTVLI